METHVVAQALPVVTDSHQSLARVEIIYPHFNLCPAGCVGRLWHVEDHRVGEDLTRFPLRRGPRAPPRVGVTLGYDQVVFRQQMDEHAVIPLDGSQGLPIECYRQLFAGQDGIFVYAISKQPDSFPEGDTRPVGDVLYFSSGQRLRASVRRTDHPKGRDGSHGEQHESQQTDTHTPVVDGHPLHQPQCD